MKTAALACLLLASGASAAEFAETVAASRFLKGNLHAHSNDHARRSYEAGKGDGDAPPGSVVSDYAGLGYDFLALTDHNELTIPSGAGLTLLPGIELTSHYGAKKVPVHVGAVCVQREAKGLYFDSAAEALSGTVSAAKAAGAALVVVNHPNYGHALGKADLTSASGYNAVELASGHPEVEKEDAAARESAEALWDDALTSGLEVWGVAADDAHDYQGKIEPGETGLRAPGKAWVQAWADSSSEKDICAALGSGHFYASMGPALKSLTVRGNEISLEVSGSWNPAKDEVEFIKEKGAVLSTVHASTASYSCDGSEKYVRARITQGGKRAWTQAYRVK